MIVIFFQILLLKARAVPHYCIRGRDWRLCFLSFRICRQGTPLDSHNECNLELGPHFLPLVFIHPSQSVLSGFVNPNAQHPEVVVIFVEQEAQPAREAYSFLQVPSLSIRKPRYESISLIFNIIPSTRPSSILPHRRWLSLMPTPARLLAMPSSTRWPSLPFFRPSLPMKPFWYAITILISQNQTYWG
jgi:hypothetical protein